MKLITRSGWAVHAIGNTEYFYSQWNAVYGRCHKHNDFERFGSISDFSISNSHRKWSVAAYRMPRSEQK